MKTLYALGVRGIAFGCFVISGVSGSRVCSKAAVLRLAQRQRQRSEPHVCFGEMYGVNQIMNSHKRTSASETGRRLVHFVVSPKLLYTLALRGQTDPIPNSPFFKDGD